MTREDGRKRGWILRTLSEPLVHFLALGGLLFLAFAQLQPAAPDDAGTDIVVDRDTMLNFMQYRAKAFQRELFAEQWEGLSQAERQALIDDYVREEALYREAKALGLAEGDYVIRQRLIQRLRFLIEDAVAEMPPPTDAELDAYLAAHTADYMEPTVYTFTHVFFDKAKHGDEMAHRKAADMLARLKAQEVAFSEATAYGDRFPFFQNYVERRADFVESHFGREMTAALNDIAVDDPAWAGPFRSDYGWHLVLLTGRTDPHLPEAAILRQRLIEDYQRERREAQRQSAIDQLISRYTVETPGERND